MPESNPKQRIYQDMAGYFSYNTPYSLGLLSPKQRWNPRYLKYPKIPVSKKGTWKYPIKDFNTNTWPKPVCYPTFFLMPLPKPVDIEKNLPVGPWSVLPSPSLGTASPSSTLASPTHSMALGWSRWQKGFKIFAIVITIISLLLSVEFMDRHLQWQNGF